MDNWLTVHLRIDQAFIQTATDPTDVIEPVWWLANFYEGPAVYEASLHRFSRPQRFVWAAHWYLSETFNGGHDQFFSNSTGAVWRDALQGLRDMGLADTAAILRESADRLGGSPSPDRDERNAQLESRACDFEDLDARLYASEELTDADIRMMKYIRDRASEFLFDGDVRRPPPLDLSAALSDP